MPPEAPQDGASQWSPSDDNAARKSMRDDRDSCCAFASSSQELKASELRGWAGSVGEGGVCGCARVKPVQSLCTQHSREQKGTAPVPLAPSSGFSQTAPPGEGSRESTSPMQSQQRSTLVPALFGTHAPPACGAHGGRGRSQRSHGGRGRLRARCSDSPATTALSSTATAVLLV